MSTHAEKLDCSDSAPAWHETFLAMLPAIRRQARIAFRDEPVEMREDLVEEVVANTCVAFVRLVERGRADKAFPSALARYAIAQIRDGRRVGNQLNVRDILSPYAQRKKCLRVERLDRFDEQEGVWKEVLVEDRTTTPAELAASRIDFPAFLKTLSRRDRRIAEDLAAGETTGRVARKFRLSAARISQLRRELQQAWQAFHAEACPSPQAALAVA